MNTFNITLDLNKSNVTTPIRLRQGDLDGTTITALILDHGATADLTGLSARFVMELPGGEHYYRKDATVGEGSVTVTINEEQAASVTGRTTRAYFQLLDGETVRASTGSVTVDILPDALEGHTVPADYDSAIQDAIDALDDAVENIADTVEDVLEDHPEWTTTVQDGSITQAKLATDLARDRERLQYRLDNLLTATLPEGDVATATDAAQTPVAGLALYGRSTQDGTPTPSAPVPIVSVTPDSEGNISLWARGRNLLPNHSQSIDSGKGITFIDNGDGSYGISGTATANTYIYLTNNSSKFKLLAGTYTLSVRDGNGANVAGVRAGASRWVNGANTSYGVAVGAKTFTHTGEGNMQFVVEVTSGTTVNTTIYPQLEAGTTATAYQPYAETVTPIDLDGHELRSLPDGTCDELTVDADGRVTLVQRVGHGVFDGSSDEQWSATNNGESWAIAAVNIGAVAQSGMNLRCDKLSPNMQALANMPVWTTKITDAWYCRTDGITTMADLRTWLASNPLTIDYKLATPVTHDLGYVAAVPLVGPDLTAQAVPTAPFALTYERDLNTTLARLEAAIAALA